MLLAVILLHLLPLVNLQLPEDKDLALSGPTVFPAAAPEGPGGQIDA